MLMIEEDHRVVVIPYQNRWKAHVSGWTGTDDEVIKQAVEFFASVKDLPPEFLTGIDRKNPLPCSILRVSSAHTGPGSGVRLSDPEGRLVWQG